MSYETREDLLKRVKILENELAYIGASCPVEQRNKSAQTMIEHSEVFVKAARVLLGLNEPSPETVENE